MSIEDDLKEVFSEPEPKTEDGELLDAEIVGNYRIVQYRCGTCKEWRKACQGCQLINAEDEAELKTEEVSTCPCGEHFTPVEGVTLCANCRHISSPEGKLVKLQKEKAEMIKELEEITVLCCECSGENVSSDDLKEIISKYI